MPHLHLETTADLPENADIPDILEALGQDLATRAGIDPAKIRAYHTLRSVWYMGSGGPPAFVHLTVFVLSGRDEAWKQAAGHGLLEVLRRHFSMSIDANEASLTVDIREMDKDAYFRFP